MAEHDVVQEISSLVEERRRFEQWMAALDAKREGTPPHVFARVRADYQERLGGVIARLAEFIPRLQELEQGLVARQQEVERAMQAAEDHRAESELRAHVGELSSEAWELVQRETGKKLEQCTEERGLIGRELAEIRALMAGTSQEMPAIPEPAQPVRAESESESESESPARSKVETQSQTQGQTQEPAEELPLLDVEDLPTNTTPPPERIGASTLPSFDPIASDDPRSLRGPTPSEPMAPPMEAGTGRLSGATERPLDDSLGIMVQGSATDDLLPQRRTSKETPFSAHVPSNNPMVLRSEGPPGKTLKCSECGSMNLPTEWYCERCGAELAAL